MKPGWSKPHTHSNPTNMALFRHKITLYKFNQGGGLILLQGGSNGSRGLSPPSPPHFTVRTFLSTRCKLTYHCDCDVYGGMADALCYLTFGKLSPCCNSTSSEIAAAAGCGDVYESRPDVMSNSLLLIRATVTLS